MNFLLPSLRIFADLIIEEAAELTFLQVYIAPLMPQRSDDQGNHKDHNNDYSCSLYFAFMNPESYSWKNFGIPALYAFLCVCNTMFSYRLISWSNLEEHRTR